METSKVSVMLRETPAVKAGKVNAWAGSPPTFPASAPGGWVLPSPLIATNHGEVVFIRKTDSTIS